MSMAKIFRFREFAKPCDFRVWQHAGSRVAPDEANVPDGGEGDLAAASERRPQRPKGSSKGSPFLLLSNAVVAAMTSIPSGAAAGSSMSVASGALKSRQQGRWLHATDSISQITEPPLRAPQTVASLSPMPAQRGRALCPARCGMSPMGWHATRRLCRSQRMLGSSGCCTLDACSSAMGMRGHCRK